jgi:hypothetical protein
MLVQHWLDEYADMQDPPAPSCTFSIERPASHLAKKKSNALADGDARGMWPSNFAHVQLLPSFDPAPLLLRLRQAVA